MTTAANALVDSAVKIRDTKTRSDERSSPPPASFSMSG